MVTQDTLKSQRLQQINMHLIIALKEILERVKDVDVTIPEKMAFELGWCKCVAENAMKLVEEES
jgi:hypothetical protein